MNKGELVDAIASKTSLSKKGANEALDAIIEIVKDTLSEGEDITIVNFGSLSVAERKGRTGKNPKTGEKIEIPPFFTVRFKIGKAFKDLINS